MRHASRKSRRSFLKQAAAATFATPLFVRHLMSAPPSGRVRHASFGANGMAGNDMLTFNNHDQVDVVAVAEVDSNRLDMLKKHMADKKVAVYQDWRELLDKEGKNLDTANVGTPDHMHAPIAMSAMQLGLHVYVQKPMAHDLYEARQLTEFAREKKLVTQMGIQIHSTAYYRLGVAVIQSGVIGKVKEVHLWTDRKWGDANPVPDRSDTVPAGLNWDGWLGVCAQRPFLGDGYYHPGNWRKRVDFGTGSLGDMGCHIFDPVFEALALGSPLTVRSEGPAASAANWALDEIIHYEFPATQYTEGPTVKLSWYDGDARPSQDVLALLGDAQRPGNGSIFIGTKGVMVLPHIGVPFLLPKAQFADYKLPKVAGTDHNFQFINAVLGKATASASFDYSGPLTETVLLGTVSTLFQNTTLEWDGPGVKFKNSAEANQRVRRTYRQGWEVKGLS